MYVLVTDSLGNPTLRYPATARSDTKYGFTAAIPNIQLNIWNGDTVQLPSRYLIATVEELDSQLWTVNSIKPNTDNTVSLTVAEYSDAIYQEEPSPTNRTRLTCRVFLWNQYGYYTYQPACTK